MDSQALITALFGAAIGAIGCYFLVGRHWWRAAGLLAIGSAALLNMITEGPHSPGEDTLKWVATVSFMVIFAVALAVQSVQQRRPAPRPIDRQPTAHGQTSRT
jgi:hypothetical protein